MRHPMECHITDFDDEPPEHEDEEVRDALTQEPFPDGLVEALMDKDWQQDLDDLAEKDRDKYGLREVIEDIGGVYRPGFMTKFQAD